MYLSSHDSHTLIRPSRQLLESIYEQLALKGDVLGLLEIFWQNLVDEAIMIFNADRPSVRHEMDDAVVPLGVCIFDHAVETIGECLGLS